MYRHILVALDNSDLGRALMKQAIALAQSTGAMPLIPVPEYYPSLSATTMELYQEEWKAFEAKSLGMLEGYRTQAVGVGLTVAYLQKSGSPGRAICEVAQTVNADLIMVGRRGHSGLSEFLAGSVSNYVVHHASTSVLVCNAGIFNIPTQAHHEEAIPT
jgi:nucleotide-binding universal stress UspA family protein